MTPDSSRIRSLTTKFRLIHVNLKCSLRADGANLPEWGFKQGEVVCEKKASNTTSNLWNVEFHKNEKRIFYLIQSLQEMLLIIKLAFFKVLWN